MRYLYFISLFFILIIFGCSKEKIIDGTTPKAYSLSSEDITYNSVIVYGETTGDESGATITERGFVYGTNPDVTLNNAQQILSGNGVGKYQSTISGLNSNTKYYIKAYSKNIYGVGYGTFMEITTYPNVAPTITTESYSVIKKEYSVVGFALNGIFYPYRYTIYVFASITYGNKQVESWGCQYETNLTGYFQCPKGSSGSQSASLQLYSKSYSNSFNYRGYIKYSDGTFTYGSFKVANCTYP